MSYTHLMPKSDKSSIFITTGEPAGIGMDIVLDVLLRHQDDLPKATIVAADFVALCERAKQLGLGDLPATLRIDATHDDWQNQLQNALNAHFDNQQNTSNAIIVLDVACDEPVQAGKLSVANAKMVEKQLSIAHHLADTGVVQAIVTAPIQKSILIDAGICLDNGEMFSGHTEYFMHKANCQKVVMMLANSVMKVALVTTHLPLRKVADAITADEIKQTVGITHNAMVRQFGINNPVILVCGLNPHAGENGHLGDEELTIINPALRELQAQGINVSLAMPADTLFTTHHLQRADAVIAMYHDQGLAPLKSHGFGDTVNITLGLPYVRTSVDHGTALDLAGTGRASSSSLLQAIKQAVLMINANQKSLMADD